MELIIILVMCYSPQLIRKISGFIKYQREFPGDSWLGLWAFTSGAWVPPLVGELRFCKQLSQKKKKNSLDEEQTEIKIAGGSINNLRYADDTTIMAESKEELKSLWLKVKEESEKADLKLNIQKTKIMASDPITSDGETMATVTDFIFLGLQNRCRW